MNAINKIPNHWSERYVFIPKDDLPSMIGNAIHLSWASSPGFVWILHSIDGDSMLVHTPKTLKPLKCSTSNAIYTKKWQHKLGL